MDAAFDRIDGQLQAAWRRSDDIFALLRPEALQFRPIVWRHPFIFYLGHLPAFAWNQVRRGRPSANPYFDDLFSRGIIRPSFRNWYPAHYPYVFAKFRCASNI
jgi:hypothetical protein